MLRRAIFAVACLVAVAAAADDLATARNALADKLFDVAERQALRLLTVSGTPAERSGALLVFLQALAEQGRHAELLRVMESHAATVGAGPVESFAYWRALALLATGQAPAAREAVAAGLAAQPAVEDANSLRRLQAQIAVVSGDAAMAVGIYEGLDATVTKPVQRAAMMLEWAHALDIAGRAAEAAALLARLPAEAAGEDSYEQGRLLRAALLERLGRNGEAQQLLGEMAADVKSSESGVVRALVQLARCQLGAGDASGALVSARAAEAAAMRPDTKLVAGYRLGEILVSATNTFDEGVARLKSLVREFPEAPEAREAQLRLAGALFTAGRFDAAAAEYQVYIEAFGETGRGNDALGGRARALFELGRFSEAASSYQKLHDIATNAAVKAESLFRAADAVAADKRFKQAAQMYRNVQALYGASALAPRALFNAADVLERGGENSAAEGVFGDVARQYGGTAVAEQALLRLATLQSARNAVDAAVATYGAVLAATTNNALRIAALLGRGNANYRAFRFDAALQDFNGATIAGRKDGEAEYWQVMTLYSLGRDEEAYRIGLKFADLFPQAGRLPDITLWLAKYDYNRGNMAEAGQRFLNYADRWPDAPWADAALLWAGRASFRLNDFIGAVEILGRLWKLYPESKQRAAARFVQADALCELARFDEAVLLLNEVISRCPESDWVTPAWGRKGDALFSLGVDNAERYAEAMAAYGEMLGRRDITPAAALQGEFKIARCLEKMKRLDDAIEHYYTCVIVRFLKERSHEQLDGDGAIWFARAAFSAADLLTQKGNTAGAARMLKRVADADVPGSGEALQRLQRLERMRP